MPPLNGHAVKILEDALGRSPNKVICIEINNSIYQLSREGRWFKFSLLTKKHTVKRSTIFQTITEIYNLAMHGQTWHIAEIFKISNALFHQEGVFNVIFSLFHLVLPYKSLRNYATFELSIPR